MKPELIILVIGAASAEGEYVARALLRQHRFRVRIMVSDATARRAQALQRAGAELFTGDTSDPGDLQKAMTGVYGVFGHSDHWKDPVMEWNKGKNLADAAYSNNVQHLVFHSMPPVNDNRIESYIRSKGIRSSFIQSGFFFEYFLHQFAPQKDGNGAYHFEFPLGDLPLSAYSVEDLGNIVAALFESPEQFAGRTIRPVAETMNAYQYAAVLSRVLNKFIYYTQVPLDVYAAYDLPFAASWAGFFETQGLQHLTGNVDKESSYTLYPRLQGFEAWALKNRERFLGWFNSLFEAIVI